MASLILDGIHKAFGSTTVLRDVSLDIADGEFVSLVGPSGCGKTTLLRIIAGLDHADRGRVLIDSETVDNRPPKQRDVAMVFQSYALYPYMSVQQNLALPLTMRLLTRAQRLPLIGRWWPGSAAARRNIEERVLATAQPLGLAPLLQRRPAQLSGGQRQRVALGRAMVRQPKVFLMDEPLSNLDATLRVATRAEIAQLHRQLGATFVYVTHDQVEAMTMSDRVAVMMDGQLLQVAPPQQIYDDPVDLRVASFIGTPRINSLPAEVGMDGLMVAGTHWPLRVKALGTGEHLTLGVRPEWFTVVDANGAARSTAAQAARGATSHTGRTDYTGLAGLVEGTLVHREQLGAETLLHVRPAGLSEPVVARLEPALAAALQIGSTVRLATQRALAFDKQGRRLAALQWTSPRVREAVHG